MQTVDPAPAPVSDVPAALRLAELHTKKSRGVAARFGQLARAWRAHGRPEEAERFLRAFEADLTEQSVMRGGPASGPGTLRQRADRWREFGRLFNHGMFVEVALLWNEFGRLDDAKRCMKTAEAATGSMRLGRWAGWNTAAACLRGWLAMGRPDDAAAFLDGLRRKLDSQGEAEDWVSLAKLRCMFFGTTPAAAQCLRAAEARAACAMDLLAVAGGWLACLLVEDAARCAREAEGKGCDGWPGGWRAIASFWRDMGCQEDARRCAAKAEEGEQDIA